MRNILVVLFSIIIFIGCMKTSNEKKNIMPEDMPEDFHIIFEYGVEQAAQHDSINTLDNIITKDLVIDGLAQSELNLELNQIQQIYSKLAKINVIEYPNNFSPPYKDNPEPGINVNCTPSMEYKLKIHYDDIDYELYWHNDNCSEAKDAVILEKCFDEIITIIRNLDEYKALPETNGGYD